MKKKSKNNLIYLRSLVQLKSITGAPYSSLRAGAPCTDKAAAGGLIPALACYLPLSPPFSCHFSIFPLNKSVKKNKQTRHDDSFFGERQQVICLNVAFALIVKESLFLFRAHTHTTGLRH